MGVSLSEGKDAGESTCGGLEMGVSLCEGKDAGESTCGGLERCEGLELCVSASKE